MKTDLQKTVEALLGRRLSVNNQIDILVNGNEIFPAMLQAIEQAEQTIELCTYVYWKGKPAIELARALADAAKRGVDVRIILDAFGSYSMASQAREVLKESACEVSWFRPFSWWLPFNNHRTHRKILVCDAQVGFIGGVGIASQWDGDADSPESWRDTHFRVRGPMMEDLRAAFWDNWLEMHPVTSLPPHPSSASSSGSVRAAVVTSTANNHWSKMATLLHGLINQAEQSIDICSPYLVPGRKLSAALVAAARRGVTIRILTASAAHSDSMMSYLAGAYYVPRLLRSGVEIYQYRPTFIHAKLVLFDGEVAVSGSTNINQRSLKKDDEASFIATDRAVCAELVAQFDDDLEKSRCLSLKRFRGRGLLTRLGEIIARPFSEST